MNWDTIQGQWTQFKGKVKEKWGDLTDDDRQRQGHRRGVGIVSWQCRRSGQRQGARGRRCSG